MASSTSTVGLARLTVNPFEPITVPDYNVCLPWWSLCHVGIAAWKVTGRSSPIWQGSSCSRGCGRLAEVHILLPRYGGSERRCHR